MGNYDNVSPLKHDVFKIVVVLLALFTVYGPNMSFGNDLPFFDDGNVVESWVGRTFVIIGGLLIFYEMVQPYVLIRLKML